MSLILDSKYSQYDDNTLVRMSVAGDGTALLCLFEKFRPLLRSRAFVYKSANFEYDDLLQEAMTGFYSAILAYNSSAGRFSSFAKLCVDRALITFVRSAQIKRAVPIEFCVNIEDDSNQYNIVDNDCNPLDLVILREDFVRFKNRAKKLLTDLEYRVFCCYLSDENYEEIATSIGGSQKTVDNALQRIRRKLK